MNKVEREKLRESITANNTCWRTSYLHPDVVTALLDHIDALERDAERYQWLRSHAEFRGSQGRLEWYLPRLRGTDPIDKLDESLDAAIASAQEAPT
jgi:hypothetical protein